MKYLLILTVLTLGLSACASRDAATEEDEEGRSSDNSGFTGPGFTRESDPISKHQQYMNRGL